MTARKEIRSIADLASDIAHQKRRAAQAHFAGAPPGQESPREVYLAACASIGSHLEESFGFKYSKSGPRVRRKSGDFTFQISFQSDRNNVSGERVGLWIHVNVLSARIKKWRESQPRLDAFDYVAGGQIGNLQEGQIWNDWDLADASKRDIVIRDAISAIQLIASPYFAKFEDLPSLFESLVSKDLPAMTIDRVIEFLLCFADQPRARLAAANFLKRRPDMVREYHRDYGRYAERGLNSEHASGYAKQLAFASHLFGFGDLTAER